MKYIRRLLWFFSKRMLALTLIFSMLVFVFYLAMNAAMIFLVLNEGMEARAGVALGKVSEQQLADYFTREFLEDDPVLQAARGNRSPYMQYTIRSYAYAISLEWIWSWPWESTARVVATERLPYIDGELPRALMTAEQIAAGDIIEPPQWRAGQYEIRLVMLDGRWKIDSVALAELLPDQARRVTPNADLYVTATPAHTPVPTLAATATPTSRPPLETLEPQTPPPEDGQETPEPTQEPTLQPTAEPTAVPTPEPTFTPQPPDTSGPFQTPLPTAIPTDTPAPGSTPLPPLLP